MQYSSKDQKQICAEQIAGQFHHKNCGARYYPATLESMIQLLVAVLITVGVLKSNCRAEDSWPQFRGPTGDGQSNAKGLPIRWNEKEHVTWKTAVHDRGWSSPVVFGQQVWMTTATEDGTKLFAVCVDRISGEVLHDLHLFDVEKPQFAHKFNTYASPTPVIEDGHVYITFGSPGTTCLDTKTGKAIWTRRDFVCNHFRGAGSSPIVFGDLLIMNFDGSDYQFVVALNKDTGQTVWRTERSVDFKDLTPDGKPEAEGDFRKAFSTPHVALNLDRPTLLSSGARAHYAYDPLTGKELWRVEERTSHSASSRPISGLGLVFILSGWSSGELLAIHPGKDKETIDANRENNLSATTQLQLAWKSKRNVPKKPGLILDRELLYGVDDNGVASCLEARTGKEVWRERIGGNYSASPIVAEDHIYFFSEEGKATVLTTGREFNKIAENLLEDGFMSSPAVAGKALFLRTKSHIYRIEEKEK